MNFTRDYHDDLDGDFLACKPGNIAEGLHGVCNVGMPLIGTAALGNGLWMLYLVFKIRRQRIVFAGQKHNSKYASKVQGSRNTRISAGSNTKRFSFIEKVLLTSGVASLGNVIIFFSSGFGTMYPTYHIRGQIGDAAGIISTSMLCYNYLLQHRAAKAFKSSIPQPQGTIHHTKSARKLCHNLSVSTVLDMLQSWFLIVYAFVIWGLLYTNVISRGWFTVYALISLGLCGLRTFSSIVLQRLATLKKITIMVNGKGGTYEEILRRRNFLTRKLINLVVDLTTLFLACVLWPASMIFLGSTFNSRQFAIHVVVMYVPMELNLILISLRVHSGFNIIRKRNGVHSKSITAMKANGRASSSVVPKGMSQAGSSSVAMESDV